MVRRLFFVCGVAIFCLTAGTVSAKDLNVGAFFAMTGSNAFIGQAMSRGAMTAVDQVNEAGGAAGYNFKLVITDFKNIDPNATVTGVRKMIDIDNTPVILASFSGPTLAAQPIAAKAKVLLLNGGAYSPQLLNKPYLYTTRPTQDEIIPSILQLFWKMGIRKLAVIYTSDPSGDEPVNKVAIPTWTKMGGTIVAKEAHGPGMTDYGAYLARIKATTPDAIFNLDGGMDIAYVVKGAREMGLTVPISITTWSQDHQRIAGGTSENVYSCMEYFDRESSDPRTQQFVKDHEQKWKEPTENYAANYYDAVYHIIPELINRVIKKGGNPLNGEQLEQAIWSNPSFPSVFGGDLTFNRNGSVKKPIQIFKIEKGELVLMKGALN